MVYIKYCCTYISVKSMPHTVCESKQNKACDPQIQGLNSVLEAADGVKQWVDLLWPQVAKQSSQMSCQQSYYDSFLKEVRK